MGVAAGGAVCMAGCGLFRRKSGTAPRAAAARRRGAIRCARAAAASSTVPYLGSRLCGCTAANLPTKDEARRIAANVAKLPELRQRPAVFRARGRYWLALCCWLSRRSSAQRSSQKRIHAEGTAGLFRSGHERSNIAIYACAFASGFLSR